MVNQLIFPNTFIIGAPKCGTTAMASYLSKHPEVFFSTPKEPFFWCHDFKASAHEMKFQTLEEYLHIFSEADTAIHRVVAEGSTRYLQSKVAIQNIIEYNPDAKFIAMVRNPVDLAPAHHMEQIYSLHEDLDSFEEAWAAQEFRAAGEMLPSNCAEPALLLYTEVASLGTQIKRLFEQTRESQRLIIFLEDLKANPSGVYRDVLRFLDLPDDGRTEFPVINSAHRHRSNFLANFILAPPTILERPIMNLRQHLRRREYPIIKSLKSLMNVKESRPPLSNRILETMRASFRDDIEILSELTGRDLSQWLK